ncbi:HAD family hydrolase [Virgibacillus halodenitrificans]|uniref:HAD family hydrolase n=1 Tax=Virgibacillus halodenitrificans TaxID=1482 RepID=UPI0002E00D13|nr:HAD family hydrolase [Virgibacillus halodenitrificans]MYL45844.1 Cof-type HAD-IIB family hydrolase [Virgibacillus halodenitrificans]
MTYKILFLDIDGTILKPDHTYETTTKNAIKQVKDQGIEVFLATGRPLHEVEKLASDLEISSYIGYNGAFAVYQNETIINEPMRKKSVEEFLQISEELQHDMVLYSRDKNYFTSLEKEVVQKFIETFQLVKNDTYHDGVSSDILGATVINVSEGQAQNYEIEPDIRLSPVNVDGAQNSYDIIRNQVNKGEAVKKLLDRLEIPREKAIAFGDGMNDKEMLMAVGEGFAMSDGHPDLAQYAKHQTTAVTDSGIYNGLRKLGLVK